MTDDKILSERTRRLQQKYKRKPEAPGTETDEPPYSERITNGGFETGDLTGWQYAQASATDQYSHSGTYSVFLYQGWIRQYFSSVPKSKIITFGFWQYGQSSSNRSILTIFFSDNTQEQFDIQHSVDVWEYVDCLPLVPDGKNVIGISINGGTGGPVWGDDFSLVANY